MSCRADRMTIAEIGNICWDCKTYDTLVAAMRGLFAQEQPEPTALDDVRREVALTAQVVQAFAWGPDEEYGPELANELAKLKRLRARQAELEAQLAGKVTP